MSFYNRNKKSTTKINANLTLAQLIEQAGSKPEYRAIFYDRFLKDYIYVLVEKTPNSSNNNEGLATDAPILVLDDQRIPVFTSLDSISDNGEITDDISYMKVRGRSFLEMTFGSTIIVNPFSKIYKNLVPEEISQMLNGSIFNTLSNPVLKAQMQVKIGKPEVEPTALLEELTQLFSTHEVIDNAYIGWTFNPMIDKKPHYIFAIETIAEKGQFKEIADMISNTCVPHLKKEEFIDIIKLEQNGNFSDYFYKHAEPFYKKQ
ncbi:enhanced serine sensitivity protein SseB [Myroides phaeus]|uniref:enhanced serine sensitivity protein SseB n=1 Tax=Myroides phaeus TaxID=702745 RepID=UPI001303AFA3|nr:enhanced serine sensitivity protein SseB [Myroides phaeus]